MTKKRPQPTKSERNWQLSTRLVRGGRLQTEWGETSEALFLNSAYSYETAEIGEARFAGTNPGFKYGRYSHPNLQMLEERLSLMENAEACIVTGSGMSALFAVLMCQLKSGDHVVASKVLFSSCHYIITQILPRFGISYSLVDGPDLAAWGKAITKKTRVVFIETPANPTLELIDIAAVAKLCKKAGAQLVVDNVFATPLVQSPLELGADVVMYSTTKHIDGQGRTLGGAILGRKKFIEEVLQPFCRHTGPHMSPFNAWVLLKSLETLELRVDRHCSNAAKLSATLEKHPKVSRLLYPGSKAFPQYALAKKQMKNGGPMIAIELKGGKKAAFRFMNALTLFDISNNLGNAKSLVTHPSSTTHASLGAAERKKLGISDDLIRLSIGIEDARDLEADILQALKAV
ncbi:MAG: aminotransferase class I/II-fold pyridoxal phosphate-dependent enzyme [Rickettsiales bacterium]|nr:aminotransferase class I/II-fold pyridoxal phosphate-dependent enzyme [Rickettsiales bacterium]